MIVTPTTQSRLDSVDLHNLVFGTTFTDHMVVCHFKNGAWEEPEIMPYGPFPIAPGAPVFHYGQAIFEGMKAYKDQAGECFLFRPLENWKRFNKSATRLAMPEVPEEIFMDGLHRLVHMDSDWVVPGFDHALYLRPFMFANGEFISAKGADEFTFMIVASPAGAYYKGEVKVKVEEEYARAAKGGVGEAKAAGNYAGAFYPTKLAQEQGFTQLLWTDAATHSYLEESGTMNIMMRVGDTLVTPSLTGTILEGITRKSVIKIARDHDITVEERPISVDELLTRLRDGSLTELFGVGTAVIVSPISEVAYRDERYIVSYTEESWAPRLKNWLLQLQHNKSEDPYGWRVKVQPSYENA